MLVVSVSVWTVDARLAERPVGQTQVSVAADFGTGYCCYSCCCCNCSWLHSREANLNWCEVASLLMLKRMEPMHSSKVPGVIVLTNTSRRLLTLLARVVSSSYSSWSSCSCSWSSLLMSAFCSFKSSTLFLMAGSPSHMNDCLTEGRKYNEIPFPGLFSTRFTSLLFSISSRPQFSFHRLFFLREHPHPHPSR
jgi:hypothetical protein